MVDGFSSHRDKGLVEGFYVSKGDKVTYCPVACEPAAGSSGADLAEHIQSRIRYLATLTAGN